MGHFIHLGYASFIDYITRKGFIVQSHAKNRITFFYKSEKHIGKTEFDPYYINGGGSFDCGYITVKSDNISDLLGVEGNSVQDLKTACMRPADIISMFPKPVIKIRHCRPHHRPEIRTKIDGEELYCLNSEQPPSATVKQ